MAGMTCRTVKIVAVPSMLSRVPFRAILEHLELTVGSTWNGSKLPTFNYKE